MFPAGDRLKRSQAGSDSRGNLAARLDIPLLGPQVACEFETVASIIAFSRAPGIAQLSR